MACSEPLPRVDPLVLQSETERLLSEAKLTTVALYSTQPVAHDRRERVDPRWSQETPAAWLAPEDALYHRLLLQARRQLPAITSLEAGVALTPPPAPGLVTLDRATVMLLALPSGGHVVALWLLYDLTGAHPTRPLPELFDVVDAGRWTMCCDDRSLLDTALEGTGLVAGTDLELGPDFHAITFLPTGAWAPGSVLSRDAVQRLVSRRDRSSRPDFLTARLPPEANRYEDMVAAVTPGASVLGGHDTQACVAFLLSAVQAIGSLSSLRQLQRRAFGELTQLGHDQTANRSRALDDVERNARDLRELQLDLSHSVETYLDIRLLIPSLPVQQYHADLMAALAVEAGARVTGTMLERLEAAQRARVQELAAQRDGERDVLQGTAAMIASIAIPITLSVGFLGINTAEVPTGSSLTDARFWPWYGAFFGLTVLIVLAGIVRIWRLRRSPR